MELRKIGGKIAGRSGRTDLGLKANRLWSTKLRTCIHQAPLTYMRHLSKWTPLHSWCMARCLATPSSLHSLCTCGRTLLRIRMMPRPVSLCPQPARHTLFSRIVGSPGVHVAAVCLRASSPSLSLPPFPHSTTPFRRASCFACAFPNTSHRTPQALATSPSACGTFSRPHAWRCWKATSIKSQRWDCCLRKDPDTRLAAPLYRGR